MSPISAFVVFQIIWWCLFFMVLPIGVQTEENPQKGFAASAPKTFDLKHKIIVTTLISAIIWMIVYLIIANGIIDFTKD